MTFSEEYSNPPKSYTLDDIGLVDRFVDRYDEDLKYVEEFKRWFYWDGARWAKSIGQETEAMHNLFRGLHNEAAMHLASGRTNDHSHLTKFITKEAGRIPYLLGQASKHANMRIKADWLDLNHNELNCGNVTINVASGDITQSEPKDLITKKTNTLYLADAKAPLWDEFLETVLPDAELRAYVQRLAGYSLLGGHNERLCVFLYGSGRNGKSVFVETLREVLGDYAVGTPVTTFLDKKNETGHNDLVRLQGARLVAASEFEEGAKVNTALLKRVTGDEMVTARPLYGAYFDFPFVGTIWISTNHMPFVGSHQALWDRIKVIPFTTRIADDKVDVQIKHKLALEAPGILQWCLEGAKQYVAQGLAEPPAVIATAWEMRTDQDLLAPFVAECADVDIEYFVTSADLYRQYVWWAMQAGEKPVTKRTFGLRLSDAGYMQRKATGGVRGWQGLRLKANAGVNVNG